MHVCAHVLTLLPVASMVCIMLSVEWLTCRMRLGLQVVNAKLMELIVFAEAGVIVDKDIPMDVMIVTRQA